MVEKIHNIEYTEVIICRERGGDDGMCTSDWH